MNILDLLTKEPDGSFSPKLDKGQRMLFVGRSGSGKTNAEVSFPGPSYTADFDNRMRGAISAMAWLGEERFKTINFDFYNASDGFAGYDSHLTESLDLAQKRKQKNQTELCDSLGALVSCLALDSQRLRGLDKKSFDGKVRGKVHFLHPDDYNYVSTAMRLIMFDRIFPLNELGINTIFSAWVADKWGKPQNAADYAPNEVIGERILGPENIMENFLGYFDEQYYFRKEKPVVEGQAPKFTVEFNGAFAKSALGLPPGKFDITGKNFYQFWRSKVMETLTPNGVIAK